MSKRRVAQLLCLSAVAPLALAACEKPTPGVTVWSGTTSQHVQAVCWSDDAGAKLDAQDCQNAAAAADVTPISVVPASTIGISVDPAIAEHGWYPAIAGSRLTAEPLTTTYFRFALGEQNLTDTLDLNVLALGDSANTVRGLWVFQLTRAG